MAYAALVSLAQTIDLILNYHQDFISPQVKDQVISIHEYVIFFQAFLEDFPDKANGLEGRIKMAAHVAEDIIEFFMSEQIHESKFKSKPKGHHHEQRELKLVTKEIESIAEKVMEIKNSTTVKDVRLGDSTAPTSSSRVAPLHKDVMVGFDDNLMVIKSQLCGESSKLEAIPIVGMGGIGKTTLARNVYDDPLIMEYFQVRYWITVSQDYSVQEIVSGLLISMKLFNTKDESMKEHHVYQNLKSRRYLIVLDDLWCTKAWDDLKMMFPDDGNGSRIILTTRLLDVASYANSYRPVHEMRLMDEDQSWNLLRQKVFEQDPCPIELEDAGKMISRSCKGLPLAVVVISGILAVDQTKVAWVNIAKDVKSAISADDEQFDKILSLSYTHLPHHLRPCFLYMGGFPEDYEMRVSKLIKLWVAEGFLKPNGCNKNFEEAAEEYLEDLVKRSLVLVTKRKSNGKIKSINIHDLMREMCIRKAEDENFFLHVHGFDREGMKIPYRLSVHVSDLRFLRNYYGSTIRTIIHLKHTQEVRSSCLRYFKLLRILDLSNAFDFYTTSRRYLPAEVFELFHLRYLAFDCQFKFRAGISNLQNLQTLVIGSGAYRGYFVKLPLEIWRMPQLRHLLLHFGLLPFEEGAAVALESLQTLWVATNFVCTPNTLKMIPNLKKLGLSYTRRSRDIYEENYQLQNLIYLQQLENLKLTIDEDFPCPRRVNPSFPRTLKKLALSGLGLSWKDLRAVGLLPNLEVLKLRNYACYGDTWETTEGEFSELKFLLIEKSHLQHWMTESSHFPRLKCLVLHRCRHLSKIPYDIGEIPTLELIKVDDLNKSLMDSAKQIQHDQQSCGNDALQVVAYKRWI